MIPCAPPIIFNLAHEDNRSKTKIQGKLEPIGVDTGGQIRDHAMGIEPDEDHKPKYEDGCWKWKPRNLGSTWNNIT